MTDSVNDFDALPLAQKEVTETNKDTIPEYDKEIVIPVKYNKQVMNLDVASAGALAQKGLKFDSISKDFA